MNKGILYIIGSPIGNIKDISLRALETLKSLDLLFCEDTRVTQKLLSHYDIKVETNSYHEYSDNEKIERIKSLLDSGKTLGLISDCGMPLISDPGYFLVKSLNDCGYKVEIVPGPTAFVSALCLSSLPSDHFMFYGFLDHKDSQKKKELTSLLSFPYTLIFYESPLRVKQTLGLMYKIFGNRRCVIVREITKIYEERIELELKDFESLKELKGEVVLLVEGCKEEPRQSLDPKKEMQKLISDGTSIKEASKIVASLTNSKASDLYNSYIKEKK